MRIVLAGVLGGIAMFVWTSMAHVALPLGHIGFRGIPNEQPVLDALHDSIGEQAGLYFFPWVDMKSETAMQDSEAKMKVSPSGLMIYHPPGRTVMGPGMLISEFLKEVLVSLIASLLLAQAVATRYAARVGFVTLTGIAAGITTNASYWIWYGFPTDYTVAYASTEIIGYLAAGLVIAAIVKRPPAETGAPPGVVA